VRWTAAWVVCLVVWPAGAGAVGPDDWLRFGVGLGVVGQLPVGDDVGQPGGGADEFEPALALQVELLTFDVGRHLQVVPFFRASVLGGANAEAYEDVLAAGLPLTGTPETRMAEAGVGARVLPVALGQLRPFVSGYVGYATARARYGLDLGDLGGLGGLLGGLSEDWRHTGVGLTVGLGLRWDLPVTVLGDDALVPLIVAARWTKHLWLELETADGREAARERLAPEDMHLDALSAQLGLGVMF
jgi:hypothetical protein